MVKSSGIPLVRPEQIVIENDPQNPKPGFGWRLSQDCLDELKQLEDNMRLAHLSAPRIWVD